jgi:hypothetical protein
MKSSVIPRNRERRRKTEQREGMGKNKGVNKGGVEETNKGGGMTKQSVGKLE